MREELHLECKSHQELKNLYGGETSMKYCLIYVKEWLLFLIYLNVLAAKSQCGLLSVNSYIINATGLKFCSLRASRNSTVLNINSPPWRKHVLRRSRKLYKKIFLGLTQRKQPNFPAETREKRNLSFLHYNWPSQYNYGHNTTLTAFETLSKCNAFHAETAPGVPPPPLRLKANLTAVICKQHIPS